MSKIIWLQGGFGNILFQIIPALSLDKNRVYLSSYLTKSNIISTFLGWKIHHTEFENFFENSNFNFDVVNVSNRYAIYHVLFGFISKKNKKPFLKHFYFQDNVKLNGIYSNSHYFGYFQSKKFLENHTEQLDQIFKELRKVYFDSSLVVECAVHFRYGDSVWAKQNYNYYTDVKNSLKNKNCLVTIVTDSKDKAIDFFKDLPNFMVVSGEVMQDFSILLSAKILYAAPSTFSWWSANASLSKEIYMSKTLEDKLGFYNSKIITL
jgi:hypothetical protein